MSFILPSRGRPELVHRFAMAYRYTDANAPVCLYLDSDDKTLPEYRKLDLPRSWAICVRERAPYNPVWHINNRHFEDFPDEPWYGHVNDDMVPRTYQWDKELIEAAGGEYIAYGDDMLQGKRMCTAPVIGGNLVRRVGRLMFDGLNIDTAWMLLGFKYGLLRYRPDVRLEHMHWTVDKAPLDDTYMIPEDIRQGGSVEDTVRHLQWVLSLDTEKMVQSWGVEQQFWHVEPKELGALDERTAEVARAWREGNHENLS